MALEKIPLIIEKIPGGQILLTDYNALLGWSRKNSLWPLTFGLACCAIE